MRPRALGSNCSCVPTRSSAHDAVTDRVFDRGVGFGVVVEVKRHPSLTQRRRWLRPDAFADSRERVAHIDS